MNFFREKKKATAALVDYAQDPHMYLWHLEEAFRAAIAIFEW